MFRVRDPTFKFLGFRERYISAFKLLYTASIHYTTSSTMCYNCIDGRGLFQEQHNFKNEQSCHAISKSDSRFDIGLQFRKFSFVQHNFKIA